MNPYARSALKWNGWGWNNTHYDFGGSEASFWPFLKAELGCEHLSPSPPLPLAELDIAPSRLSEVLLAELGTILTPAQCCTDAYERVFHARGRSFADLLDLRHGQLGLLPDAVLYPERAEQLADLLALARREKLALIPFGGGSSVVGGVNPPQQQTAHQAVLTLDLSRMKRLLKLDPVSLTATFEAGIYGPQLENILQARGFSLGHTPQSFEFSTLGGWIAARGAGDRSNRYGKMEDLLVAARVLTPAGEWRTWELPASAAGPDLKQLIAGSEGLFGVITEATVRIHALPPARHHTGMLFHSFAEGLEALRQLAQSAHPPAMLRLSDEAETHFLFRFRQQPGKSTAAAKALKKMLAWRGLTQHPALLLLGLEGDHSEVWPVLPLLTASCVRSGGFPLGSKAGESWSQSRYSTPYLRDTLMDQGIGVETLETATTWSRLLPLYEAVKTTLQTAIDQQLVAPQRGFVMTHISHCYPEGASLYFTFAWPMSQTWAERQAQYQAIKNAACETLAAHEATLSHHHGLGAAHAPWLAREKGPLGKAVLQAIKAEVDPEDLMNPGKWF